MAEVEWEHEKYFRSQVVKHWLGRRLPIWQQPAAKDCIRASFRSEMDVGLGVASADVFQ